MTTSVYLLTHSVKKLPIVTVYTIWSGIGAIGTVICGIVLFKKPKNIIRILSLIMIIVGVIGLKFNQYVT